jgi:hypothetical protein
MAASHQARAGECPWIEGGGWVGCGAVVGDKAAGHRVVRGLVIIKVRGLRGWSGDEVVDNKPLKLSSVSVFSQIIYNCTV